MFGSSSSSSVGTSAIVASSSFVVGVVVSLVGFFALAIGGGVGMALVAVFVASARRFGRVLASVWAPSSTGGCCGGLGFCLLFLGGLLALGRSSSISMSRRSLKSRLENRLGTRFSTRLEGAFGMGLPFSCSRGLWRLLCCGVGLAFEQGI